MNIVDIERAITSWIAGLLGMTVDRDVFRGGIPHGHDNAIGVLTNSEYADNSINFRDLKMQILGRFDDRDNALRALDAVYRDLPRYGMLVRGTRIDAVTLDGDPAIFRDSSDGKDQFCVSVNLMVSCR